MRTLILLVVWNVTTFLGWTCLAESFFVRTSNVQKQELSSKVLSHIGMLEEKIRTIADCSSSELVTPQGIKVPVLFFDRNKDKVLIIGQGFPGCKEDLIWVAQLFTDYDVMLFDYRWHVLRKFLFRLSTLLHPIQNFLLEELEEVRTVVTYVKNRKQYNEVVGLGICYSNFIFAKLQAEEERNGQLCFSKLIFDSCWFSLMSFAEEITLDPWLPLDPQEGGAPDFLKSFLSKPVVRSSLLALAHAIVPHVTIEPYLSQLQYTPLLFIHGLNDKLVPYHTVFEKIWLATAYPGKVAFVTPFQHSANMDNSGVYKYVCDLFIKEKSPEEFVQKIMAESILA